MCWHLQEEGLILGLPRTDMTSPTAIPSNALSLISAA